MTKCITPSPRVPLERGDLVHVLVRLLLLSQYPDPVVQPAVAGQGDVEEGPAEATDQTGGPSAVATCKEENYNHEMVLNLQM